VIKGNGCFHSQCEYTGTFRVVAGLGREVGVKGPKALRVTVGMDGKAINAYTVHQRSKVDISFSVKSVPLKMSDVDLVVRTEESVEFSHDGTCFLFLDNCLLVELGIEIHRWLKAALLLKGESFYFVSMDEEEEPLLSLYPAADPRYYQVSSCWLLNDFNELISVEKAVAGAKVYIESLQQALQAEYGFDIGPTLVRIVGY
jgi:hypothetical protein